MQQKYQQKADFVARIFNLEEVVRPAFVIGPGVETRYDDFTRMFLDPEIQLAVQLAEIQAHEEKHIDDDYVPMLMPWFGVAGMPEGFGCNVVWSKTGYPAVEPVLKNPKDITAMKKPDVRGGLMGKILEFTQIFQEETSNKYPICLSEHMSPLEIVFTLMETTQVLYALMDEPKLIHDLLNIVTETTISFISEQRKVAHDYNLGMCIASTGEYIPDGYGIWLSADSIVNLSPELFVEYFAPYANILSEEYGGVFLHSCGNFEHLIDSFDAIKNLRGIDFGASETSFELLEEAFGGTLVLAPHLGLNDRIVFDSLEHYSRRLVEISETNTGKYFQIQDINSLGYGTDVVDKIGSYYSSILDEEHIRLLTDLFRERK
ncbi:MAG: hypothetical protein HN368_03665 [Spirochaetales bacterium]|jgi:uroporphyrinogen-III decarboxylase|nr:hypothetical protein [Spirochaetales bacterium]